MKRNCWFERTFLLTLLFLLHSATSVYCQSVSKNYIALQEKLCKGWNTWSYGSMLTQVLLPEGLGVSINFRQSFIGTPGATDFYLSEAVVDKSRLIKPIAHTHDGSYTELQIENWHGNTIRVQTASLDNQLYILVTPLLRSKDIHFHIELSVGMMWNGKGTIERNQDIIYAKLKTCKYIIRSSRKPIEAFQSYQSPYLVFIGDSATSFYTGPSKTPEDINAIINRAKNTYEGSAKKYGQLSESFEGIQTVLGWNTIYDAEKKRVITPVSRGWNKAWQGFVLFEWDTYFAAFLFGLYDKDYAYSNAIAVTKGINRLGHIGHWQMPDGKTAEGMSQPPVGSMICWKLYQKYHDVWFLKEVYPELLTWNRWWIKNRNNQGTLSWGGWKGAVPQIAAWESGMDNSPMYENTWMKDSGVNALQNIWDVGLNSLFVNDCHYLEKMATVLGKPKDAEELRIGALQFQQAVLNLWNDSAGIFLNRYLDSPAFSYRLSPTLFYPMLAGIAVPSQARQMIEKHFYNPKEFYSQWMLPSISFNDKDYNNDYWKGSIWPPLNFLVWLGLRDYDPKAAKDLADKSYLLFKEAWTKQGAVFENINSSTGLVTTSKQANSDPFYHWGALMAIMEFIQEDIY